MRTLQDLFEKEIHERIKPEEFSAYLISKWFTEEKGIQLTKSQYKQLKEGLQSYLDKEEFSDGLSITLTDEGRIHVSADIGGAETSLDISKIAEIEINQYLNQIPNIINDYVSTNSQVYHKEIKKHLHHYISEHRKGYKSVEKRLFPKWGQAIELLDLFIILSLRFGSEYNDFISDYSVVEKTPRFEVLIRSHARSCQIASEILYLLKGGFADGAHARWRTLHEIAVETSIIKNHDDNLAKRFLEHDIIQKYKFAQAYQEHYQALGYDPISPNEMKYLQESYFDLLKLYGEEYKYDNGWAAQLIKGGRPNFYDLENLAKFEHMRPRYKFACLNVHSGPRGLLYRLGLDESQQDDILLAGPSVYGLGDPIMDTAYSLLQTTGCLLTYKVNIDYLVALSVLHQLEMEIFNSIDELVHT